MTETNERTTVNDGAIIFARVMEYQGKTRREVVNPCLTARECIALANYIAASDRAHKAAIPAPEGAQAHERAKFAAWYWGDVQSEERAMFEAGGLPALLDCPWGAWQAALAAPAPQEPAWQPIETAPKDGTAILAFWKPVSGSPASHCYGITEFVEGRWRNPEEDDDYYIDPTHWMPLPAAPQTKEPKA